MANSSILGGAKLPEEISGKDMHALGPSDNSDSGSDAAGAYGDDKLSSDSDAAGTGERASADSDNDYPVADVLPDHIEKTPGFDADTGLDNVAGDDFDDLSDIEELADDSDGPDRKDGEEGSDDDDGALSPSSAS